MHIAEISKKKDISPVEYLWNPIGIGRDTLGKGFITNQTIQEVIQSVNKFREVIAGYRISSFKTYITSNIRESGNSDVLIERLRKASGVTVEISEPSEESEIVYEGIKNQIKNRYSFNKKNFVLFSIGAGSTHIILQSKGKIIFSETHHIGTIKFAKDYNYDDKFQFALNPFSMSFQSTLKRFPDIKKIDGFIGINEDILPLAQKIFHDYLTGGMFIVPRKDFNKYFAQIENMSLDRIKDKYQISDTMLKTSKITFILFGMFYNLTAAPNIIIPNVNPSFFNLYKIVFTKNKALKTEIRENIISSALSLGKKYQFDRAHADAVTRLSLAIFDELSKNYDFSERERIYLEVASLLHDIGYFVGTTSHNKHSSQLISSSEIIGLQRTEMNVIGQIARYHRKSPPKPSHTEYIELSMEDRMTVSRMSSILRIADALDNTHSQIVEDLKVNIIPEKCEILVRIKNNRYDFLDIIRNAVKKKSDLFESFYGILVTVEKLV
jgi:exopolyphosphatase/guanosine-5'-triphosphate,3'-diphosphate pyrophosphatase